jgi:hypothetical protein
MANKQTNTALLIGGAAVLGYLVFKKSSSVFQAPAVPPASAPNVFTQGLNLLTSIFNTVPAADNSSNPNTVQVVDPYSGQPSIEAPPPPTQGMTLQLAGVPHKNKNKIWGNLTYTGMPASSYTPVDPDYDPSVDIYSWAGSRKGVFKGKNKAMFPFHNGTNLAIIAGCLACGLPPRAIGKINWEKYIIPVGVVVGGYVLLKSTNLFSGLTTGTTANNQASAAATKAALDNSIANAKASGDIQTLTDAQLATLANDIYVQGVKSTPDLDQIQRDIIQVNTLTDLLKMMQSFGTREANTGTWFSVCAFTGLNCTALDMATFVRESLDQSHIAAVNGYLQAQGINFQF